MSASISAGIVIMQWYYELFDGDTIIHTTNNDSFISCLTGAVAFIRSVTIEAVGLGVHLAAGAHDILMKTEHALTTVPPPLASCEAKRTKHNIRANQPESAQQGMKQVLNSSALQILKKQFGSLIITYIVLVWDCF